MWYAYEDVFYGFWFSYATFMATIVVCFFLILHVSTLWLLIPQFMQYLLVLLLLLCVFSVAACLVLYDTESHSLLLQ